MISYQDFINAKDKKSFMMDIINGFKRSDVYKNALDSQNYYEEENTTILQRSKMMIGRNKCLVEDITKANNQIPCGYFPSIVKQANSYLLGNGADFGDNGKIKDNLGKNFDIKVQRAGIIAHVDSVAWAYCFIGKNGFNIDIWRGCEFIPLLDEETGALRGGLRFWQVDSSKPIYIEMYEETGKTKYKYSKEGMEQIQGKQSYIITNSTDILEDTIIGEENWSVLPIVPLYCKDNHKGTLTKGLKHKFDLYDLVFSDFGNNLEDMQDVYWVLKNYGGQDLGEFIEDYKYYKSIKVAGDGEATPHTIDIPWEARNKCLDILRKDIYESAMALDVGNISGGSITNLDIKALFTNLDLKTNEFEWNCKDFIEGIITLYKEYSNDSSEYNLRFIRNVFINETETINNILTFREDISHRKALELNPMIKNDEIDEILLQIEEEGMSKIEEPQVEEIEPIKVKEKEIIEK